MSKELLQRVVAKEHQLARQRAYELWGDRAWTTRENSHHYPEANDLWVATLRKLGGFVTIIANGQRALVTEDASLPPEQDRNRRANVFGHLGAVLEDLNMLEAPLALQMLGLRAGLDNDGGYVIGVGEDPFRLGTLGERRIYNVRSGEVEVRLAAKPGNFTPVNFMLTLGNGSDYTYGAGLTLGGVPLHNADIMKDWRIPAPQ